jgi:hypothetical protein
MCDARKEKILLPNGGWRVPSSVPTERLSLAPGRRCGGPSALTVEEDV